MDVPALSCLLGYVAAASVGSAPTGVFGMRRLKNRATSGEW
jgi:hypothetical protein